VLLWLENSRTWERLLNPPEGFYPKIGTITPGSGLSVGAGFRKPGLLQDRAVFSLVALGSFQGYWQGTAQLLFPELAGGRVFGELSARAYDYASEAFFGSGPESRRDAESYYGLRNTVGGGTLGVRIGPYASVGGGAEYLTPSIDRGKKKTAVQDLFTPADTPGLDRQPDFGRYFAFAEVNTRNPRGNPRTGGLYAVRYARYDDLDFNAYSFGRVDAEVQQYFGLFNQRRVLAFRGLVSSASADSGQQVPFYLQPTLGGPDDLRGFRRNRFRDDHLMLFQAEYRWEVFTAMDAAFFADWGKVASRRQDLTFDDLEHDYGFGVRFGTDNGVFLRIEGAFGSRAGKHFVFRFGDAF
jgi:outer membrane protein assembly factor BamA